MKRVVTARKLSEDEFVVALTRISINGKKETCPLCKEKVTSVALHYLTCKKLRH